jgi:dihydrofolate reductase
MEGGTTFYFVTEGIRDALARAREAANGKDIRIGGGVDTIQQFAREDLIDEMHIAISPAILGGGERLFDATDLRKSGWTCVRFEASEMATHAVLKRNGE